MIGSYLVGMAGPNKRKRSNNINNSLAKMLQGNRQFHSKREKQLKCFQRLFVAVYMMRKCLFLRVTNVTLTCTFSAGTCELGSYNLIICGLCKYPFVTLH